MAVKRISEPTASEKALAKTKEMERQGIYTGPGAGVTVEPARPPATAKVEAVEPVTDHSDTEPDGPDENDDDKAPVEDSEPETEESLIPEDQAFVGRLLAKWAPHDAKSLSVRHEMGLIVVGHWKHLEKDTKRRRSVLKVASEQLAMSTSDLSRLRAFAERFPTFEEFTAQHPQVRVWSAVKTLLADLNDKNEKTGKDQKPKKTTDKQRETVVKRLNEVKQFVAKAPGEFAGGQIRTIREDAQAILDDTEEYAPAMKSKQATEG